MAKRHEEKGEELPRGSRELVPVKGKKSPRLILSREVKDLPVVLTSEELAHRGRYIGERMGERTSIDERFTVAKQQYKAELETVDAEIERVGRVLQLGSEIRQVECQVELNWDDGRAETIRLDTGEIVESRALTPDERQREMFRGKRTKPPEGEQPEAN